MTLPRMWVAALAVLGLVQTAAVAQQSSTPPPATPAAGAAEPKAAITIESRRADLQPRISAFVQQIAGSYYEDALARWFKDVCPFVSGLPDVDREAFLARFSEVARDAHVPLAGEKCRPNLYILMTEEPQELLKGMDKRNHSFTFGDAQPALVDAFIATPRAVRVWYHATEMTPEQTPLIVMAFPDVEPTAGPKGAANPNTGGELVNSGVPGRVGGGTNLWSQPTRLFFNAVWDINRVFVIVDTTRLQGVSKEQLGDYVAMVSLAEIKSGHRADSATILNLFSAPAGAPVRMSDWDQAYLKALYVTDQKSTLQRALIANEMVREIVH